MKIFVLSARFPGLDDMSSYLETLDNFFFYELALFISIYIPIFLNNSIYFCVFYIFISLYGSVYLWVKYTSVCSLLFKGEGKSDLSGPFHRQESLATATC